MNSYYNDDNVFIRSISSRGSLGGISEKTDLILEVFDSSSFDVVLVETVGVIEMLKPVSVWVCKVEIEKEDVSVLIALTVWITLESWDPDVFCKALTFNVLMAWD